MTLRNCIAAVLLASVLGAQPPASWRENSRVLVGPFNLGPDEVAHWRFEVPKDSRVRAYRISGAFSVTGGDKMIIPVVVSEPDFETWRSGQRTRVLYGGQKVLGDLTLDLRLLSPGVYVLAFKNHEPVQKRVLASIAETFETSALEAARN